METAAATAVASPPETVPGVVRLTVDPAPPPAVAVIDPATAGVRQALLTAATSTTFRPTEAGAADALRWMSQIKDPSERQAAITAVTNHFTSNQAPAFNAAELFTRISSHLPQDVAFDAQTREAFAKGIDAAYSGKSHQTFEQQVASLFKCEGSRIGNDLTYVDHLHEAEDDHLGGVVTDRENARIGDITAASVLHHQALDEVVLTFERRVRDSGASPELQFEKVEFKVKLLGLSEALEDRDAERNAAVAAIKELAREYIRQSRDSALRGRADEPNFGTLLADLREMPKMNDGTSVIRLAIVELTASNSKIVIPGTPDAPVMLDGFTLSNCKNLILSAARTPEEQGNGTFSTALPHLHVVGASGDLIIGGIDCSHIEIAGSPTGLGFVGIEECNLIGARVVDLCTIRALLIKNSNFGNQADFSGLMMDNPPSTPIEFELMFGGTMMAKDGDLQFPKKWGFSQFTDSLKEITNKEIAARMKPATEDELYRRVVESSQYHASAESPLGPDGARLWAIKLTDGLDLVVGTKTDPANGSRITSISLREDGKIIGVTWPLGLTSAPGSAGAPVAVIDDLKRFFQRANRHVFESLTDKTKDVGSFDDTALRAELGVFAKKSFGAPIVPSNASTAAVPNGEPAVPALAA